MTELSNISGEKPFTLASDWQDEVDLARRYATSGPRYTSYPTAPQFTESFRLQDYLDWQSKKENHQKPLSLYVHVPFCNDICYYCACNKIVTRKPGVAAAYLKQLTRELSWQSELVGDQRPITQMHWGGGTPTYLDDAEMTELMHALASRFRLLSTDDREYSIEIDPRTVAGSSIALLKGVGFNRISLGIQDFDERVQKAINRVQPYAEVAKLVDTIRAHGFQSLSFDLIYGLPFQSQASMLETLRKVIDLRPDRIACYNYAHLPERFLSQRSIDRLTLPQPEDKLRLAQLISSSLQNAGYRYIGMDHYVLPGDELAQAQSEGRLQRNFQGYSLQMADDLLGLGVSSISQIGDFYLQNARELPEYYDRMDKERLPITRGYRIDREDKLRRHVIMSLICDLSLNITECENDFGIDFHEHFAEALVSLHRAFEDGLINLHNNTLSVSPLGRPFLRNLCMPFDAYLKTAPEATGGGRRNQFSATV